MTEGVLIVMVLALATLVFVLAPLLARDAAQAERVAAQVSREMDLQAEHEMLLKDLEDDRASDKLDDHDYRQLQAELSARAVEVLKQLDQLEAPPRPRPIEDPPGTPS